MRFCGKHLILGFIFIITTTCGQGTNYKRGNSEPGVRGNSRKFVKGYLTLSIGENFLFPHVSNGQLGVSFPYVVTTQTETFQKTFNATVTHLYSSPLKAFSFDIQRGSRNHFFDFEVASGSNMGYFSFGYGRKVSGVDSYSRDRFIVKPSVNIGFYAFDNTLGHIDAQGKFITVLDHTADSTFSARIGVHSHFKTYRTKYIDVDYLQYDFILNPKIAVEYHPFKTRFFMEFSLSYFLPLSEIAKIRLEKTDGGNAHQGISNFPLNAANLTTTFNGMPITNPPFTFGGLQFSLKIGI